MKKRPVAGARPDDRYIQSTRSNLCLDRDGMEPAMRDKLYKYLKSMGLTENKNRDATMKISPQQIKKILREELEEKTGNVSTNSTQKLDANQVHEIGNKLKSKVRDLVIKEVASILNVSPESVERAVFDEDISTKKAKLAVKLYDKLYDMIQE